MSNDPNRRKPNKPQPGGDDENRKARRIVVLIVAALIATLLINSLYTTISNAYLTEITYTEFKELLSSGQISEVEFQSDDRIIILTKDQAEKSKSQQRLYYTGLIPNQDTTSLTNQLDTAGVKYNRDLPEEVSPIVTFLVSWVLPVVFMYALFSLLMRGMTKKMGGGLGGIGENLPKGRTPSMYDYQLYTIDCATHKTRPMTKDFDPSIESMLWSHYDGKIYFNALDRDYRRLYRMDPKSGKIEMLRTPEDYVGGVDMAETAPVLCYNGQSAMNVDRLYSMNTANGKSTRLEDQQTKLADVDLPTCQSWNFKSSRGDTIYGRYYLPPHFDATKKYPMIVYYYGGCSPTSRYFGGNYPFPLYATKGYVVYVIEPSGAAGFGQEFASRHVDTAGDGVADDIIEGTKKFCADHSFVNAKKIGCLGASYGGFMTQYLQTKTDLFAAAVSHAGISDHTQYWGSGYWGYSYSEVSMANRYPWSDRDLYVNHSPLYNINRLFC